MFFSEVRISKELKCQKLYRGGVAKSQNISNKKNQYAVRYAVLSALFVFLAIERRIVDINFLKIGCLRDFVVKYVSKSQSSKMVIQWCFAEVPKYF